MCKVAEALETTVQELMFGIPVGKSAGRVHSSRPLSTSSGPSACRTFVASGSRSWSPYGVCLLSGPNGAGKTSVLDALDFLRNAVDRGIPEPSGLPEAAPCSDVSVQSPRRPCAWGSPSET